MLASGKGNREIRRTLSAEWGCTEQNVHYFINKAMKAMQSVIDKRLDYVIALQRERLELILNGAIEKKDFSTAQKIIDTMNKLYGLYTEKKEVKLDAPEIKFEFGNTPNEENNEDDKN